MREKLQKNLERLLNYKKRSRTRRAELTGKNKTIRKSEVKILNNKLKTNKDEEAAKNENR